MLDFLLHTGIVAAIYGIAAISLNLQAGIGGLLNFGQVAFFGLGAYGVGIASYRGLPLWVGAVGGILAAVLAGAAVGRLGRTLLADYWAIATLALAELVRLVFLNEEWLARGADGIGSIPGLWGAVRGTGRDVAILLTVALILVGMYLIAERITKVQFGRVARLMREQPNLTAALGYDIVKVKVRVMMVGAAIAAVGGALLTTYISFIGPNQLRPVDTFLVWAIIVVGGLGNHVGVILGAVLINLIYVGSRFANDYIQLEANTAASLRLLLVGLTLMGFLLFRTNGLIPERLRKLDADRG
jgi:branched-chain amino acid transport system permease protein